MSEWQAIVTLGLGTVISVVLIVWIIRGLIPSMLQTFHDEMEAERQMHLSTINQIVTSMREIREEVIRRMK